MREGNRATSDHPWNWVSRKTAKLTDAQVRDVILHCLHPRQDAEFAAKLGVHANTIAQIRKGHNWWSLREKMMDAGEVQ